MQIGKRRKNGRKKKKLINTDIRHECIINHNTIRANYDTQKETVAAHYCAAYSDFRLSKPYN